MGMGLFLFRFGSWKERGFSDWVSVKRLGVEASDGFLRLGNFEVLGLGMHSLNFPFGNVDKGGTAGRAMIMMSAWMAFLQWDIG